jgi:hypothetical protein
MQSHKLKSLIAILLLLSTLAAAQSHADQGRPEQQREHKAAAPEQAAPPAEDISGMYSFLREGEFVQINLEQNGVSGYISRRGDLESDRGAFLDQFFSKASVQGHEVAFTTKPLHGVVYDFKGHFERGPAKSKTEDGYYVVRGTLKEIVSDGENHASMRSREVVFKLLAEPSEESERSRDKD